MRQALEFLVAAVARLWLFPLYLISGFTPRDKNIWLFGSWGGYRYADNGSAFFEYCTTTLKGQVHAIWISRSAEIVEQVRSRGGEAYWIWSPHGIWYGLRAGFYFFDCFSKDVNFWLSRGAQKVNLWSGVPLKTFERDIDKPGTRYYRLFHGTLPERVILSALMPWHVVRPDMLIASSPETRRIISSAFDVPVDRIDVTGLPRNDSLSHPVPEDVLSGLPESFLEAMEEDRKIIVYLPTFRDNGGEFMNFDWQRLDDMLVRDNGHLFIKFHPMDKTTIECGFRRITVLPTAVDAYSLLPCADGMISDFSSLVWDYLLLRRPLMYFVPDLDEFVSKNRSLNFDVRKVAVGPVCFSFDDLYAAIGDVVTDNCIDWYGTEQGQIVLARLHSFVDDRSCARVLVALRQRFFGESLARSVDPEPVVPIDVPINATLETRVEAPVERQAVNS